MQGYILNTYQHVFAKHACMYSAPTRLVCIQTITSDYIGTGNNKGLRISSKEAAFGIAIDTSDLDQGQAAAFLKRIIFYGDGK